MASKQKLIWEWPGGKKIEIDEWVLTLSAHEQEEFFMARQRQLQYRSEATEQQRLLEITEEGYIWINEEEALKNKPNDPIWETYFKRWCDELGIKLTIVYENINE